MAKDGLNKKVTGNISDVGIIHVLTHLLTIPTEDDIFEALFEETRIKFEVFCLDDTRT